MGRDEGNELLTTMLRNSKEKKKTLSLKQEPITWRTQLPHIAVMAFSQNDLFLVQT